MMQQDTSPFMQFEITEIIESWNYRVLVALSWMGLKDHLVPTCLLWGAMNHLILFSVRVTAI